MKILKQYSIPVHRKLTEGSLLKMEKPRDSLLYLNSDVTRVFEDMDNTYTTKIYSINKYKTKTIIKSNTLGLKITDKKLDNTWLYKVVRLLKTSVDIDDFKDNLIEDDGDYLNIYMNTDDLFLNYNDTEYLVRPVVLLNNSFDLEDYIDVDRNNNDITVTINTNKDYNIELISSNLFQPKLYNNTLEFNECVIPYKGSNFHLYSHTYFFINRSEIIQSLSEVKRPFYIKDNEYYKTDDVYKYKSYNSNLVFLISNLTSCYFYLKKNSVDMEDVIFIKDQETISEDLTLLFKLNTKTKSQSIVVNPLYENTDSMPVGEKVIVVDKRLSTSKYSNPNNIPLGCSLYNTNIESLLVNANKITDSEKSYLDVISFDSNYSYDVQQDNRVSGKMKDLVKELLTYTTKEVKL